MRVPVLLFTASTLLIGQAGVPDTNCPRYPESLRTAWDASLQRDVEFNAFHKAPPTRGGVIPRAANPAATLPRANFIDSFLFDKMTADGVAPAPATTDADFLRRASLDLTGRIPQPDAVTAFLTDSAPDKRTRLIETLLASDAYVSQTALYLNNRLQVTRGYPSRVTTEARNNFYSNLTRAVAADRSYRDFVQELLTGKGDPESSPGVAYFVRWFSGEEGNPPQDFWDDMTDYATTQFLGFRSACISCHNGRGHLENINLYLTPKTRAQFWNTSAFLSRTDFFLQGEQDGGRYRYLLQDRTYGSYTGAVPATNPGNRPQRVNANVTNPVFMLDGGTPTSANWRSEFATLVTGNRQFARATVNYLWAYYFGTGIVDPPDGWDLARIDPANPPKAGWPIQNSQPALLEALTDAFIQSNYSLKTMSRLIVSSNVYQLSSRYNGPWNAAWASDFARHSPRRLSAEELWDSIAIATQTEQPMNVAGFAAPVLYANQLPDAYEPWGDGTVTTFMSNLGRGNLTTVPRDSSPTLLGLLFLMNNYDLYNRTSEPGGSYQPLNRAQRTALQPLTDADAIRQIFLATLTRYPTDAEITAALAARGSNQRITWLPRLQWALVNKLDFIFDN